MTLPTMRQVYRSAGFYPLTGLYLVGVSLIWLITSGRLFVIYGVLILSIFAIFALLLAAWRELKAVHKLVDGQRAELLARIDELVALLIDSGVVVPPSGKKEKAARDDEERDKRR